MMLTNLSFIIHVRDGFGNLCRKVYSLTLTGNQIGEHLNSVQLSVKAGNDFQFGLCLFLCHRQTSKK